MASGSSSSSGLFPILGTLIKAFRIPGKNFKAKLSITLLVFLPFCLLALGADLSITPLVIHIVSELEQLQIQSSSNLTDNFNGTVGEILRESCLLLGLVIAFLFSVCVVSLVSIIAAVNTSVTNYNLQELDLKELVLRVVRASKGQLITWIYLTFMTVSLVGLILISIGVLSVTVMAVAPIVLGIIVTILGTLCYLYLAAIWILSLVLSVVDEEDFRGAKECSTVRRRLEASVLILGFSVASVGAALLLSVVFKTTLLETEISVFLYMCVVKLFLCVGHAVFYYEYKSKYGEVVEEEEERAGYYAPLTNSSSTSAASNQQVVVCEP